MCSGTSLLYQWEAIACDMHFLTLIVDHDRPIDRHDYFLCTCKLKVVLLEKIWQHGRIKLIEIRSSPYPPKRASSPCSQHETFRPLVSANGGTFVIYHNLETPPVSGNVGTFAWGKHLNNDQCTTAGFLCSLGYIMWWTVNPQTQTGDITTLLAL